MYYKLVDKSSDKSRFISFSNSDLKRWVMPVKGLKMAMNLYQPSGRNGWLVKRLLPYIYWLPMVRRVIDAQMINIALSNEVYEAISEVVGVKKFQFSIFEGTPSAHQKTTIQVSQGDNILAYCKISQSEDVASLFRQEQQRLDFLQSRGVEQVPKCLFCGRVGEYHLFIQSTKKSCRSTIIHRWTKKHSEFLELLHKTTKAECRFEESDLAKSLCSLEVRLNTLPSADAATIGSAIEIVRAYYTGRIVEFSGYHGDFTPWNMFFEKGELFVFDLEYYQTANLPYSDMFHYITQIAILERKYTAQRVYSYFKKETKPYANIFDNISVAYLAYLLGIISFYFRINPDSFGPTDNGYRQWVDIIKIKQTLKEIR